MHARPIPPSLARRWLLPAALFAMWCAHSRVRADEVASAVYLRTDSDSTTVISPRLRGSASLGEDTRADATYAADIWSSASVDIRASASVRPVTEQRDELVLQLSHELEDLQLHGGYRFSIEHDYTSHGGSLGARIDLANNAATLEADLHIIADTVGQSGRPDFDRSLTTVDGTVSFTQVLDPAMFALLTYELAYNHGYQASPYRYVGAGGTGFGCVDADPCLPEHVPDVRLRHAIALVLRRALSEVVSLGVSYRFYFDDWALRSHTVLAELGWNLGEKTLLSLRYRFYTQGAVEFYQAVYQTLTVDTLRTRDRELSALTYQRAGAELEHTLGVGSADTTLAATLAVSGNLYSYADFVGLSEVVALEVSAGLMVRM